MGEEWKRLGRFLIFAYNNGYSNYPTIAAGVGYPADWLRSIGFRHTLLPLRIQPDLNEDTVELADAVIPGQSSLLTPLPILGILLLGAGIGVAATLAVTGGGPGILPPSATTSSLLPSTPFFDGSAMRCLMASGVAR